MLDIMTTAQPSIDYWDRQPTDQPWTLNGFRGTWAFSDHSLIPGELNNFLMEVFHPVERLKRIPLDEINRVMNEVWEGPGSMSKLARLTAEMRIARQDRVSATPVKLDEVRTIDDYSEDEFSFKPVDEKELADADDDE